MEHGWYTITHHTGETQCDCCGWPLYVGDRAYLTPGGEVVCSRVCREQLARREELSLVA